MIIGIVGSEEAKFTPLGKQRALDIIQDLVISPNVEFISSGHCHLGGIDIWAEDIAKDHNKYNQELIFEPAKLSWEWYKLRNLKIVEVSQEVHCITVGEYPEEYTGMKFRMCYHCEMQNHIKSGGCWTMHQAIKRNKNGFLHIVNNY